MSDKSDEDSDFDHDQLMRAVERGARRFEAMEAERRRSGRYLDDIDLGADGLHPLAVEEMNRHMQQEQLRADRKILLRRVIGVLIVLFVVLAITKLLIG